jgi:hypothetical protein
VLLPLPGGPTGIKITRIVAEADVLDRNYFLMTERSVSRAVDQEATSIVFAVNLFVFGSGLYLLSIHFCSQREQVCSSGIYSGIQAAITTRSDWQIAHASSFNVHKPNRCWSERRATKLDDRYTITLSTKPQT